MPHPVGSTLKALVKLPRDPAGCWVWLGNCNVDGVPQKEFNGKSMLARRWLWQQLFGPIGDGLVISLSCGNAACVSPFHFRMTTHTDAVRAGSGTTLLPVDVVEVKAIPAEQRNAVTARVFSDRLGVSVQLIRDIWRGNAWGKARKFRGPKVPRNQHSSAKPTRKSAGRAAP